MQKSEDFLKSLNTHQRQAVKATDGPVLVVAGAGTGKTKVIVERIKGLITGGIKPSRILALTFTEKAATEMQDRVHEALGGYYPELGIYTFNAYGEHMLREFAADSGLSHNFRVMGENAVVVFLRERLDSLGLDYFAPIARPDSQLTEIRQFVSRLKQNVITPEVYDTFAKNLPAKDLADKLEKKKHTELAHAYNTYVSLAKAHNVIDYDDQLYLLIELMRNKSNVGREIAQRYDHVMIDEFQDTNRMQSTLVDMIVGGPENLRLHAAVAVSAQNRESQASRIDDTVQRDSQGSKPKMASKSAESAASQQGRQTGACSLMVVGDDDQSIYGWRGATLANILDFKKRYPDAQEISLTENYRSTQAILDHAYQLIQANNPHRLEVQLNINKKLTARKKGPKPTVHNFETIYGELEWVANDIQAKLKDGVKPGDVAILMRRNAGVAAVHDVLAAQSVPHVVIGQSFNLYREPVVRHLLEGIKAVVEPTNNTSLYHLLTGPLCNLPVAQVSDYVHTAKLNHQSLWDILHTQTDKTVKAALQQINSWRVKSASQTVRELTYAMLTESGYRDQLISTDLPDDASARVGATLLDLFQTMKEFESVALQPSALQYVDALPALEATDSSTEDGTLDVSSSMVNVLSVHKAKGLEWPIVYILDCTEGSFPLAERSRGIALPANLNPNDQTAADSHMSEERRLMYVAMTRAKDELILTYANRHYSTTPRKPSRFLGEAFGDEFGAIRQHGDDIKSARLQLNGSSPFAKIGLPSSMLKDGVVTVTASQARVYQTCPLDFYYRYVLRVPELPTPAALYGSVMHTMLETINKSLQTGTIVSLAELERQFKAEWPTTGFQSAAQRDRAYQQGLQTIKKLHRRFSQEPRKPVAVEESFKVKFADDKLYLRGRFDAVFQDGEHIEIVDYKTATTVETAQKAKTRANGSEQLTLYALAWQQLHGETPITVTLDFIDTGMQGSVRKTSRGLAGAEARLKAVADGIRAEQFQPGRDHAYCLHPPL